MASELTFDGDVSAIYDRDFVVAKVIRARGAAADEEDQGGEEEGDEGEDACCGVVGPSGGDFFKRVFI